MVNHRCAPPISIPTPGSNVITNKKSRKKIKNTVISIFDISNKKKVFKFLKKNKINYIYFLASHNISSTEKETESLNDKNIKTNVISLTNFLMQQLIFCSVLY